MPATKKMPVLLAGDDEPELFLTRQALTQARVHNPVIALRSVPEVPRYLRCVREPGLTDRFPVPGAVLLDIGIPSEAEVQTLQWIERHGEWADSLPIIILSRAAPASPAAEGVHIQAHEYLEKPSQFSDLLRLVAGLKRRWLDRLVAGRPAGNLPRAPKFQNR